jgi:mannosyltransferase OCH1-like enzyme
MKKSPLIFLLFIVNFLCADAQPHFETLMGEATPVWKWIETSEDRENIRFYRSMYQQQETYFKEASQQNSIPKLLHIVWLGYEPFPQSSSRNLEQWIKLHPDWKVLFWTDKKRPLFSANIQQNLVEDFHFLYLENPYYETESYGEKSKILRLEILYQLGGVYADHDTFPLRPLDSLNTHLSFYCGLQTLEPTILSTSVFPADHLLAACSQHPILGKMLEHVKEHWSYYETYYPGMDTPSIVNRVRHRYTEACAFAIKEASLNNEGRHDLIYPAYYFSEKNKNLAKYVVHERRGKWYQQEKRKHENIKSKLKAIYSESSSLLLMMIGILVFNLLGVSALLIYNQRKKT